MYEHADEASTPAEELRAAFAHVVGTILDNHPASTARERAIQATIGCHQQVAKLLVPPPDVSALWISTQHH
jgi:hypothetical protein